MNRKSSWGVRVGLAVVCALLGGAVAQAADFKVGLVLDRGGKDDKSFNSSAYTGAMKAKDELKVVVKAVEATDDNAFESIIRSLAQKDFDLIIGVGFAQVEAIKKVAAKFPAKHFALVDAEVPLPNVRSLLFEDHEGSYLVGAIAALKSKTGIVGFIGGMDSPLIRRFQMGYEAGAKRGNPKVKILSNYVGVTGEAWNNPAKAKELAVAQYANGADVIFAAAGASGAGLYDAAEEKKKFAIGVDSNQNYVKPGFILTSMLKRVDLAVFAAIKDSQAKKFTGGVARHGISNQGVDYAMDEYNRAILPADIREKVEKFRKEIIAGKIQVPDFYKKAK